MFIALEIVVGVIASLFYIFTPEVAQLGTSVKDYVVYVFAMSLRVFQGLMGLVACSKRGVKTMKVYFWCLVLSIVYFQVGFIPLTRLECECIDYIQCQVVIAFNRLKVKNIFPHYPTFPFEQFPSDQDAHIHSRLLGRGGSSSGHERDLRQDGEEELEDVLERLAGETCTCDHSMLKGIPRSWKSCRYAGKVTEEEPSDRAWCHLTAASVPKCRESFIVNASPPPKGLWWSEDFCMQRGCGCSDIPIPHPTKKNYGRNCQMWDRNDIAAWCFVGFDTLCPDRTDCFIGSSCYGDRDDETLSQDGILEQVRNGIGQRKKMVIGNFNQYKSWIPCQKPEMLIAERQCVFKRNAVGVLMVTLTLLSIHMVAVVFIFIQNRCGDPVQIESQFIVEFSSDESEDDFDVDEFDAPKKLSNSRPPRRSRSGRAKSTVFAQSPAGVRGQGTLELTTMTSDSRAAV